jgi:hypothetical protein
MFHVVYRVIGLPIDFTHVATTTIKMFFGDQDETKLCNKLSAMGS